MGDNSDFLKIRDAPFLQTVSSWCKQTYSMKANGSQIKILLLWRLNNSTRRRGRGVQVSQSSLDIYETFRRQAMVRIFELGFLRARLLSFPLGLGTGFPLRFELPTTRIVYRSLLYQ